MTDRDAEPRRRPITPRDRSPTGRRSPASGASIIIPVRSGESAESTRNRRTRALGIGAVAVALIAVAVMATHRRSGPAVTRVDESTSTGAVVPASATPPRPAATGASTTAPTAAARPPAAAQPAAPVASTPSPVRPDSVPTPSPSAAPTDAQVRSAIVATVASYASAISTRDVGAIAGVYPSISPDDREAWRSFFAGVGAMDARLTTRNVRRLGPDRVEAQVSGTYSYTTGTPSRRVRKAVSFRAGLVRDIAGAWLLDSVR